ncbi:MULTISPECIES: sensor histidine kinase [Clostridium]|uniref:sensor histidine kinase n=1 Tax=Clostridium TaxID=1485 RepID=UPI000826A00E|nr:MULTISPECIES: HAMP domain-containing sensor histidine kinase [Clostridium]PJI07801.1 sensor histidine kinase [Clostridium sp. CT7]
MIRKLQKKFIMITMGSLAIVVFILIGAINIVSYYEFDSKMNGVIKILSQNQGEFPKYQKSTEMHSEQKFGFQISPETQFQTRYFIVKVNKDGSIKKTDTEHVAAVTSEDAVGYANKVLKSGRKSGHKDMYKYAVVDEPYGSMIIFIDYRIQSQEITVFSLISCVVALVTFSLVFILVSILSKRLIKPIIKSMEKQKQFITDAGHEIKTPLAIISANADVLELTSGKNEWITSIRNQTSRLDKLVKNLLMLSKMNEDDIELMFSDFNLSDVVFETAMPFKVIAENHNKKLLMEVEPEVKFRGDEGSINQLVSTLVDNAMKYSNENGEIKISLSSIKKGIKLEVYNTVDKIDKGKLDELFDRFYRADSSRARETGGYGIGLSIAKSIVETHHGKISAKSDDGKSIRFTIII